MKQVYIFKISTGMAAQAARSLEVLQEIGYPMNAVATSQEYNTSDDCVKDCVNFINLQNTQMSSNFKTIVEANPFLAGAYLDMTENEISYHKERWLDEEIMKIYSFAYNGVVGVPPVSCSVFKTIAPDGFIIDGNETVN